MRWILDNTDDFIQAHLSQGTFYEQDQLEKVSKYIKPGASILDVGANIGNHAIYFDKHCQPSVVYVVEPLIRAYKMMLMNSALNHCHTINFDYIGLGLGDCEAMFEIYEVQEDNMGATRLAKGPLTHTDEQNALINKVTQTVQAIQVVTGDSLFEDKKIDFIKIDVEGMDIQVLNGLIKTIEKNKPFIFIEVNNENLTDFWDWLEEHKYKSYESISRHKTYENFLIGPI
jgi:FkbM family methyltransferase